MAWNLPKAWSPQLALPGYVRAEGLQRRAFTTLQSPDGTFDNPDVNTGGYLVPKYVTKEKYGRGAYVTKWAPRGTYYGPKIPHWLDTNPSRVQSTRTLPGGGYEYSIDSLAGDGSIDEPMPEPYESFGVHASNEIMSHVSSLPGTQRKGRLKAILSKIDPTLWGRTSGIAKVLRAHGMPPNQALGRGLAKALSTGMAAEVVNLGHAHLKAGKAKPDAKGVLGLGCYGPPSLSGYESMGALNLGAAANAGGVVNKTVPCLGNPPPGYTYDSGIGKFRPIGVGETPISKRGAGTAADPTGAKSLCVTFDQLATSYHGEPSFMVGPFPLPIDATSYRFVWQDPSTLTQLPADWRAAIVAAFDPHAPGKDSASPQTIAPGPVTPGVTDYLTALGVPQPIDFNVFATPQGFQGSWYDLTPLSTTGVGFVDALYQGISGSVNDLKGPPQPIAQFQHPKTGDLWGAFLKIHARGAGAPDPIKNPVIMEITFGKMPDKPWFSTLLSWIFWPAVTLAKVTKIAVTDTLAIVGALACSALQTPGAVGSSAVAGGLTGGPLGAKAGATGAQLAAAACGTAPPMYQTDDWLLPIAVAGIIGGLAYVFTRPKKKHPTGGTP